MTENSTPRREPRGIPSGGQYAAINRPESDIAPLVPADGVEAAKDRLSKALKAKAYLENVADEDALRELADLAERFVPTATHISIDETPDGFSVGTIVDASGTTLPHDDRLDAFRDRVAEDEVLSWYLGSGAHPKYMAAVQVDGELIDTPMVDLGAVRSAPFQFYAGAATTGRVAAGIRAEAEAASLNLISETAAANVPAARFVELVVGPNGLEIGDVFDDDHEPVPHDGGLDQLRDDAIEHDALSTLDERTPADPLVVNLHLGDDAFPRRVVDLEAVRAHRLA
ncbi:MAG TPA: hypothetical protein PLS46_00400 [Microthrixaceae bacterium]|nr:hypothetical protein [Microthrixaceae bacterium]